MAHTKGPWKVGNGLPPFYAWGGQVLGKHADGSEFILATCNQNYPEQAVDDAHLIAAAPELLDALREACIAHHSANGTKPPQSWLLAIAKAEGRA